MIIVIMYKLCLISILLPTVNLINFALDRNSNSYGPYNLEWERYEACSGPKSKNLTVYTTDLKKIDGAYVSWLNFTFLEQARIDETKIIVNTVKNNRSTLLFNYKLQNPCQHYAVAKIIEKELNAKNCVVKKGTYACFSNYTEISYSFFGTSFFYGEYMLKATTLSKKGNIMCLVFKINFTKKKNP